MILFRNKNDCFILQHKMQRFIFILFFFLMWVIAPVSARQKWVKRSDGISYKIVTKDTSKAKPVYGDHIWMHLQKIAPSKKEIFNTKIFGMENGVDMEYKVPAKQTDITTFFQKMGKGDSAVVKIPASLMDSAGSARKYYIFKIKLLDFKEKNKHESDKQIRYRQQMIIDSLAIVDYLKNNSIPQHSTDNYGNIFWRTQYGSEREVIAGDTVHLQYVGKLLNQKEFDNSYKRNQPLNFIVGKKQVIDGLDLGICNFHHGDKGILIIPSRLAYGEREAGAIPENSVLLFELDIQ